MQEGQSIHIEARKTVSVWVNEHSDALFAYAVKRVSDSGLAVYRRNETSIEGDYQMFNEDGSWKTESIPTQTSDQHLLDTPEFITVFDGCLSQLPERWAASIRIKYLEDDKDVEDLGISKSNYWKMLERARTQLRLCIETKWFKHNDNQ